MCAEILNKFCYLAFGVQRELIKDGKMPDLNFS
jgi:hypothetical protein